MNFMQTMRPFYADDEALYRLILDVFYTEVEA